MQLSGTQNLIFRVTEYGMNRQAFTLVEMKNDLDLKLAEYRYIRNRLCSYSGSTGDNPNHILGFVHPALDEDLKGHPEYDSYSLLPTAIYNYIDYLELQDARKFAIDANKQSMLALRLTIFAIIISILFGLMGMFMQFLDFLK